MAQEIKWTPQKMVDVYEFYKKGHSLNTVASFYGSSYSVISKLINKVEHAREIAYEMEKRNL